MHSAISATGGATTNMAILKATHDADIEVEATGTSTPAQCEPGSRIGKIRLQLDLVNNEDGAGNIGGLFHCMLVVNPDADYAGDANVHLFNSDQTATAREIRKATIWKRAIWVPSLNSTGGNVRTAFITIRRPRQTSMQEGDHLQLWVYHGNTDAATISLTGTVYYREK